MIDVREGDCRDVLATMAAASVQCCVTSPPYYGLRDYGTATWEGGDSECDHLSPAAHGYDPHATSTLGPKRDGCSVDNSAHSNAVKRQQYKGACRKCGARRIDSQIGLEPSPDEYVAELVAVFREVRRVLRDDGVLFLNLGDSYASTPCGSFNGGGFKDKSAKTGGRDMSGVETSGRIDKVKASGLKQKDLIGIPWMVAFALRADGWYLRSDIVWSKPNPMPESVRDRPTKSHEYVFLLSKSDRYFYDADAIKEAVTGNAHPRGNGVNPKATAPGKGIKQNTSFSAAVSGLVSSRNARSVWTIASRPFPGAHFATFPPELAERCILAGTSEKGCCPQCGTPWVRVVEKPDFSQQPKRATSKDAHLRNGDRTSAGQAWQQWRNANPDKMLGWQPTCECAPHQPVACTVLDPFGGAGTTALVADRLQRHATIIELSPAYAAMARRRCASDAPLFTEAAD